MRARIERKMARWLVGGILVGALSTTSATAWAQAGGPGTPGPQTAKPASATPRPEDLEPGVNTSATSLSSPDPTPVPAPPPAPATATKPAAPKPFSARSQAAAPHKASPAATGAAAAPAPKPGAGAGKSQDRIELDTTQITGNRELPKVLYIVPWKRSDLGDLVGKPVNSLLDEVLTPVDRDVFKRENRYYDALKPDDARQAAAAKSAGDTERSK
jgi:hypothetical protein